MASALLRAATGGGSAAARWASRGLASVGSGSDIVSAAPGVSLQKARSWDEGVATNFSTTPLKDIFHGKKVVIFGLPGAYTGVCSQAHVPSYKNNIDKLKAKGVDSVICVSVNDPYALNGWAEKLQAKDAIEFYGDFDGSFHKSLDLEVDLSAALLGRRSHRWSAFVDDGKIKAFNVEEAPSDFKVSGAEPPPQHAREFIAPPQSPPSPQSIWSPEMVKNAIQYAVVDAFAAEPFKGNPAAVCLLEGEDAAAAADERWMQSVAAEFNLSETAFLIRDRDPSSTADAAAAPRFRLRWFTPVAEVNLCGHATLASAHFLFTTVLAKQQHAGAAMVEFVTRSGILTAKKVPAPAPPASDGGVPGEEKLFIELDFPMIDLVEYDSAKTLSIPETLNGAQVVSVWKSSTAGDLIVELSSGKEVADIIPNINEIKKCDGRGVIVTGPAPAGSDYDFFSRFFCPKFGIDEDPVCGSAHCVLAPYWGGKLGKQKLTAFQASPRSGTLYLELDGENRRVRIQGEAVTVMAGTLLA
uniref:Peroxiredoxin-2F, mitochondrial n=1 Tax=Oryza meridionalis TaxID=40149 RepID=A0A0E0C0F4_9ORYZ